MDLSAMCNSNGAGGIQRDASDLPAPGFPSTYLEFNPPSTPSFNSGGGAHGFQTSSGAGLFRTGTPSDYRATTAMPPSPPSLTRPNPLLYRSNGTSASATPTHTASNTHSNANYVHELVRVFKLTESQQMELVKLTSTVQGAPAWFLKMQLYAIANTFSAKNETRELKNDVQKVLGIVDELNTKETSKAFALPNNVSLDIRDYARNIISDPTRCSFKTFGDDVVKMLEDDKTAKHLSAPCMSSLTQAHKKEYIKAIKTITTDLTRQYKTDIKETIIGSAQSRAVDSLKAAMIKHKLKWRTLQSRRHNDETETAGLVIRRHLMHTAGDGRDYAAKWDRWFEDKHEELGTEMSGSAWKAYLKELIRKDEERWPGTPDDGLGSGSSAGANNELVALETAGGTAGPANFTAFPDYNP